MTYIILGVLLLGLIAKTLYETVSIVHTIGLYIYKRYINGSMVYVDLKPRYKKILYDYSHYYRGLSAKNRRYFEQRVARFLAMKEFIPRGGLTEVSDEMKVLVSSIAIQITFGLPKVYLTHFYRILIYPDSYYSTISQQYHHGEVNSRGLIILSWKNFMDGWIKRNSGINLGIHEMAHALHLENSVMNEEFDFLNARVLEAYEHEAHREIHKIRSGNLEFFREYAGTNEHEFFAVMLENFFERPAYFKNYNAKLYKIVCALLNQDPLILNKTYDQ